MCCGSLARMLVALLRNDFLVTCSPHSWKLYSSKQFWPAAKFQSDSTAYSCACEAMKALVACDPSYRWKRPRHVFIARGSSATEKGGIIRRLKAGWYRGDRLLCLDWTLLRLFPPPQAAW